MKYSSTICRFLLWILLLFPIVSFAQPKDNSPYSRFGIGDVRDRNFNYLESMGSLGASYTDNFFINTVNPASLGFLKVTAFDIGIDAKYSILNDGAKKGVWSGNISYLSLAFPLQNFINDALERIERDYKISMGINLMPYSTVGYNISTEVEDPDIGTYFRNYQGNGGTYQFNYGAAFKYKDISIGMQLGYLFGNIAYSRNLIFEDILGSYNNNFTTSYNVSGFLWNSGIIYSRLLNKSQIKEDENAHRPKRLNIGIYGNTKTSFNVNAKVLDQAIQQIGNLAPLIETLVENDSIEGKGRLPSELGIGLMYQSGDKFAIGLNYSMKNWSQYFNDAQNDSLMDSYKLSFGGFYRPNVNSYNNYLERIIYRYGAFYETDPRSIAGERVDNYGLTFGFGLPFTQQRKISHANIGLVIGNRGRNTIIKESYFKFSFSFTYNDDEWFIKRKYN